MWLHRQEGDVTLRGDDPLNILVVDNRPTNLLSYEVILAELGENLIKAGSAREALEQLMTREIAVVLTDVSMPEMDGYELAALVRQHPRFETMPIVFISASHLTDYDRLKGFEAGAVDYITAPVIPEVLRAKIKVLADLYRKTRTLEQLNAELEQRVARRTEAMSESKRQLQFVADHAPVLIAQCDAQRCYKFVNQPYAEFFGCRPADIVGRHAREVLGEQAYNHAAPYMAAALAGHRTEYDLELRNTPHGPHTVRVTYAPEFDASGQTIGWLAAILDVTDRKRAEDHLRFVMRELSHRTKNLMAVVQAISWQTAKKSLDLDDFEQRFTVRLEALARSHDLLVKHDWRGVILEDLVRAQLEPFLDSAGDRLAMHGPALLLMPSVAQELGLAMHELATNASKFGALSVPDGKVEIGWAIERDATNGTGRFHMTWRESGGPGVSPPVTRGFGSMVVTAALSTTFKGEAELDYPPEGLVWQLIAPMGQLVAELDPAPQLRS